MSEIRGNLAENEFGSFKFIPHPEGKWEEIKDGDTTIYKTVWELTEQPPITDYKVKRVPESSDIEILVGDGVGISDDAMMYMTRHSCWINNKELPKRLKITHGYAVGLEDSVVLVATKSFDLRIKKKYLFPVTRQYTLGE